jgi:hypothetical protein
MSDTVIQTLIKKIVLNAPKTQNAKTVLLLVVQENISY